MGNKLLISIEEKLPSHVVYVLKILVLAIVYFIAARIGFLFPFDGEIATLIWLATGVALSALILFGLDLWPGIVLGSILVAISNQHSLMLTIGIMIAHTAEAYFAAYFLKNHTPFDPKLETFADVFNLIIYGIVLSPIVGAIFGMVAFALSPEGIGRNLPLIGWHWWIAHSISLSFIMPLILTTFSPTPFLRVGRRYFEFLLALGLLSFVSMLIFIRIDFLPIGNYPLGYVIFPFLLWIALRFSPREVATASAISVSIAIIGTSQKTGPFSRPNLDFNLFLLATFVFSVVLVTLTLSSIFAQRERTRLELQQSHDELESRVAQRTITLNDLNEQLIKEVDARQKIADELEIARDDAIVALDYKNQILANVSHDARTPLNIIMLNADLLRRELPDLKEKQQNRLKIIDLSSHELLTFINNLLDTANIQSNQVNPTLLQINVKDFFSNYRPKFQNLMSKKQLNFEISVDNSMPTKIISDSEWLNKIVNNLISNAIKFTEKGEIRLSVKPIDEQYWQISVNDTGTGIPNTAIKQIFQPFWQVDGSTTRYANRGVGLGLSIVSRFVHLLHGSISVNSEIGKGTEFIIKLPFNIKVNNNNDTK